MLYLLLATIVFLQIGGVPRLVEALLSSYRTLPIGGGLGEPAARRAALVVVAASAKLIASGLALAAPVVVALWLTDLALGLIARAAPSVPVYFLGLPLKGLLAIGVVLLGLGNVTGRAGGRFCCVVAAVCASGSRFPGLTLGSAPCVPPLRCSRARSRPCSAAGCGDIDAGSAQFPGTILYQDPGRRVRVPAARAALDPAVRRLL